MISGFNLERLAQLEADVRQGRIATRDACREATTLGGLLIGGRTSPLEHDPVEHFTVYSGEKYPLVHGPAESTPLKLLRATQVASIGLLCGVVGDVNRRPRRVTVAEQLVMAASRRISWHYTPEVEDGYRMHVPADLCMQLHDVDDQVMGAVSVVDSEGFVELREGNAIGDQHVRKDFNEPGQFASAESHLTLASFPVTGQDFLSLIGRGIVRVVEQ